MNMEEILGGFRVIVTNTEKELLNKIKENDSMSVVKNQLDEWEQQLAHRMCSKGLLKRVKVDDNIVYKPNIVQNI